VGRFRDLLGKVASRAAGEQSPVGAARSEDRSDDADSSHPLDPIPARWNQVVKESPAAGEGVTLVTVRIEGTDLEASVPLGTTLLDAAIQAGSDLDHYCGGMCSCGSCRLEIVTGNVSAIEPMEESTLDIVRELETERLACQTRALGDVVLRLPAD
jgi:ferredoxin